jgi:hypothetical protein
MTAPKQLGTIWLLLLINVLGFLPGESMLIPIPRAVGQVVTMGSLVVAFSLALLLNARVQVRPNAYLVLLSAMSILAVASSLRLESGLGSLFRCFRLTLFVATLWLVCRWWRGDMVLLRFHLRALGAVLVSIAIGLVLAPGAAMSGAGGRLIGILWPIPPTQVGQYGAVATGLVVMMWLTHTLDGRSTTLVALPGMAFLLLSHTRTALIAMIVALLLGSLSLVLTNSRMRRAVLWTATVGGLVAVAPKQALMAWLQRGQDAGELADLTGRQKVWDALLAMPRTPTERLIGVGLTDKSFHGLPIDSTWLSVYLELGLVGIGIVVAMLVVLINTAALRPPSPERACAIFLITYSIVSSYTEAGLGDASAYLLHLAVATSLLFAKTSTGTRTGADLSRDEQVNA